MVELRTVRKGKFLSVLSIESLNQSASANRRPTGKTDGSGNLAATVATDRAFPVIVAGFGR